MEQGLHQTRSKTRVAKHDTYDEAKMEVDKQARVKTKEPINR